MAERDLRRLHRLSFEPMVRFLEQADDAGYWAECYVCGEVLFAPDKPSLAPAIATHRGQIHVVSVYPYGMPKAVSPRMQRAARVGAREEAAARG